MTLADRAPGAPVPGATRSALPDTAFHQLASGIGLVFALGVFLAARSSLLDYRPGMANHRSLIDGGLMGLFAAAALVAIRWPAIGAVLGALATAGAGILLGGRLEPAWALGVVLTMLVISGFWVAATFRRLPVLPPLVVLGTLAIAVLLGGVGADRVFERLYGPTHPQASPVALPPGPVTWVWSGAVTDTSATVVAKVDAAQGETVGLQVRRAAPEGSGSGSQRIEASADASGVVRFAVSGLESGADYRYVLEVDGAPIEARAGGFGTFPEDPASFTIALGACARTGSNGVVFETIAALDPDLFLITGDLHYADIVRNDPDEFRDVLDLTLSRPAPAALYAHTPVAYVWDDHDYGPNDAPADTPSAAAAHQVYREYVPHYPLAGVRTPLAQAFTMGRVRVLITDTRSSRSPVEAPDDADKSMLGAAQKAWFLDELRMATAAGEMILWVNPVPWVGEAVDGADDWTGYTTERAELADFIADNGIDRLLMVSGDAHMVAIDDGTNTDYAARGGAGFPLLHAAALDRVGEIKGGPYSHGAFAGGGQFGTVEVIDDGGPMLTVRLAGRTWEGRTLVSLDVDVPMGTP